MWQRAFRWRGAGGRGRFAKERGGGDAEYEMHCNAPEVWTGCSFFFSGCGPRPNPRPKQEHACVLMVPPSETPPPVELGNKNVMFSETGNPLAVWHCRRLHKKVASNGEAQIRTRKKLLQTKNCVPSSSVAGTGRTHWVALDHTFPLTVAVLPILLKVPANEEILRARAYGDACSCWGGGLVLTVECRVFCVTCFVD